MKISNQFIPNAIISPDERYDENNRAWQGAPSVARTRGGRLFVSFMSGGIYEPDPRNNSMLVYSDDNGETWSEPILVLESLKDQRLRVSDLELWVSPTGELWMFWSEYAYPAGLELPTYEQQIDMENDSEYHIWEDRVKTLCCVCNDPDADELVFGKVRLMFNAVMRNKPFVANNGRWLFPTHITSSRPYFQFYYSDDEGKTVQPCERCMGRDLRRAYDEPNFYRLPNGVIAVVVRTTPHIYKRMFSYDNGITWSTPEDFYEAASQRPCVHTDKDGGVFFIPSIAKKARNGMKLMYSLNGMEFSELFTIDDRERISYAEIDRDEEGTLYIVYDRERNNKIRKSRIVGRSEAAKEILFAKIPRAAWENGIITPDTVLARVITKARIDELDNIYTKGV